MKAMFAHYFAVIVLCMFATSVFAQNGKALSLQECISLAMKNNSDLKRAVYEVDRSGANVKGSYAAVLPKINTSFSSDRSTLGSSVNSRSIPVVNPQTGQPVIDPETGEQIYDRVVTISPKTTFNNHTASLNVSQRLFDFGRNWNTIRQAKATYESSTQSLEATRNSVFATVKRRYLELLKELKLEQEYAEAVERSKEQLNKTRSMFEIGSVAQIDVYRQEVILGTDEINLINQRNIVQIAKGNLNVAMGRDPEADISIQDLDESFTVPVQSLEEAYAIAEENNPDLKRFEYDMRSAEIGRKIAKARYLPTIDLSFVYSRDNEKFNRVYGDLGRNYFLRFGATLNFNIFNGFADVAEVSRQSAGYSIARESWINRRRTLQLEVKQAFLNLQAFREISKINERNLKSAEEDYRLALERYRVGAGTQLEVTDSQVSLTRARVNLVRSKYDALIAKAQLEAALGRIR